MTRAVRPRTLRRIASRERQRGYLGLSSYRRLAASALSGPSFAASLLTSISPDHAAAGTSPTFTRATTKTFTDWEGVVRTAIAGEACFTGARRVRNLITGNSEDFTAGGWGKNGNGVGSIPTVTGGFAAPDGTNSAYRLQCALNGGGLSTDQSYITTGVTAAGTANRNSIWVKSNTGAPQNLILKIAAGDTFVTATTTWQRLCNPLYTGTTFAVGLRGTFVGGQDALDVLIWHAQCEDVTGQSNTNPAEYVAVGVLSAPYHGANVDGVKYFATQNGNTVASNVVTEAAGAAIAPATLKGYDSWQAATNLCLQSEDLTTTWTVNDTTVGGSVTLPNGATGTKNKIQEDNLTTAHYMLQSLAKAASALVYTFSVYLKQAERTWAIIEVDDGANGNRVWFNLATGAVGSTTLVGTGFTSVSGSIVAAANGFYRCTVTATSTTATTLRMLVMVSTADTTATYAGTTGSGIYAWGAQIEQNAFATPYIATTTATVTRNADVLTYPTSGNISGTVGTCYVEVTDSLAAGAAQLVSTFSVGGIPLRITSAKVGLYDGANNIGGAAYTPNTTVPQKLASRWSASGAATVQGVGTVTTTSPAFDGNLNLGTDMAIGNAATTTAGAPLNGNIRNVRIWTRALSDAQLQALTT